MQYLHELWRTIDSEEILAGVEEQWRIWLGDGVDVVRPFLVPEQELASCYPCESDEIGCARTVVYHGPSDIVALCGQDEPYCAPLPLGRGDVVVYDLSLPRFLAAVGRVMGCVGGVHKAAGERVWSLGFRHGNTQACFVLPRRETGYLVTISMLLAQYPTGDLAVVVPRAENLDWAARSLLSQRRATLLSCEELVGADDAGRLVRIQRVASHLELVKPQESVDPCPTRPVAIGWRDGGEAETIGAEELDRWRALELEVDHFVDATLDKPWCSKRNGEHGRHSDRLTAGMVSILAAYLARAASRLDHARPENLRVPNLTTAVSRRKAFNDMRRKVDVTTGSRRRYRLFKDRSSFSGGPQEYEFRPDDGLHYCFILRFDQYQAVETAVTR
jgi:hypothetical protein